jgi:competence protein ComEA
MSTMFKLLIATLLALMTGLCMAAVDLNKGTQSELESVKGIGPAMSGRILDERKKGPFKDWDDFMGRVKGVKSASATRFSSAGLTVNGSAYTASAATSESATKARSSAKVAKAGKTDPAVSK